MTTSMTNHSTTTTNSTSSSTWAMSSCARRIGGSVMEAHLEGLRLEEQDTSRSSSNSKLDSQSPQLTSHPWSNSTSHCSASTCTTTPKSRGTSRYSLVKIIQLGTISQMQCSRIRTNPPSRKFHPNMNFSSNTETPSHTVSLWKTTDLNCSSNSWSLRRSSSSSRRYSWSGKSCSSRRTSGTLLSSCRAWSPCWIPSPGTSWSSPTWPLSW